MSMVPEQVARLRAITQVFPIPTDGLVVYIETSGFTAGSAVVVDHAVCNMVDSKCEESGVVSAGVLNWTGLLPEPLMQRLGADLDRIQAGQAAKPPTATPLFPYTPSMLNDSTLSGYDTMTHAVTAIAAALMQGRTVIGHGLLSFSWQFLRPFLPADSDDTTYDALLLEHVYDTANIEKAIQEESPEWLPTRGESFSGWQRACGRQRSKHKWSPRSHMFSKYDIQRSPADTYLARDMVNVYTDIMRIWRSEGGQG